MDGWVGAWGPQVSGGSDGEWVLGVYCYGNRSRLGVVVAGGAGIWDPGSRWWWSLVVTADQGPAVELLQRLDVVVLVVLWITVRRRECAPLQEGDVAGT